MICTEFYFFLMSLLVKFDNILSEKIRSLTVKCEKGAMDKNSKYLFSILNGLEIPYKLLNFSHLCEFENFDLYVS